MGKKGKSVESSDEGMKASRDELTMARAFPKFVVNGLFLVFGDVIVDVEVLFLVWRNARVELICDHFVGAALKRKQFALVPMLDRVLMRCSIFSPSGRYILHRCNLDRHSTLRQRLFSRLPGFQEEVVRHLD